VPDKPSQPKNRTPPIDGESVVARCKDLGFALAGVVRAQQSEFPDELSEWIEDSKHGSMAWLATNQHLRIDPREMLPPPGARSIVLVGDLYAEPQDDPPPAGHGRIAKYARGDDYHRAMKDRLHALADALSEAHPGETFRAFVDTAPVLEREHASRAGLGWIGKHTLLINPEIGSFFFLGGILTTLEIDPPADQTSRWNNTRDTPAVGHCGTCTRCIDACPTDAITPWSVDANRCISYLTIEHRSPIDGQYWDAIGDRLYGCDICQDVCPHNTSQTTALSINGAYTPRRSSFDLLRVLDWTEEDRREAFKKSAMKRAKLPMMKRNAIICATNAIHKDTENAHELRARIELLAAESNEDELVRDAAHAAIRLLKNA